MIFESAKNSIPKNKINANKNSYPWCDDECTSLINIRKENF